MPQVAQRLAFFIIHDDLQKPLPGYGWHVDDPHIVGVPGLVWKDLRKGRRYYYFHR